MALFEYSKYQILINANSKKVQGLQAGDIVRRQYFDGANTVYSLMCVLSYGTERTKNSVTGLYEDRQYFVGALLDGDELSNANKNEIFDFVRITNLFNTNRSGALYLTASDNEAPFMDVIDGIGKEKSLSWPEGVASEAFEDSESQYIIKGAAQLNQEYTDSKGENNRILTVTRTSKASESFEGLKQDFYQFVRSGNKVLISYKARGSKAMPGVKVSVGYSDDLHKDAEWTEDISTSWEYKFQVATVEYSGRHLRSFKFDMSSLEVGEEIQIADFNIILLSSVANFDDASATRIGKLDGVTDSVFGQLDGYGAYLQKLYASRSAHISGTLTAGDENGFGATFYAGKIHRNCFVNSLSPNFTHDINIISSDSGIANPTGIGSVYSSSSAIETTAQTNAWMIENVGGRYCFSFWLYIKQPANVAISQNGKTVGEITIQSDQTHEWIRHHVCFNILQSETDGEDLLIGLAPTFAKSEYESVSSEEDNPNEKVLYFAAPQLESGNSVTQYQATDDTLNQTTEYGAWFNRGGIGGTMQNPLLQLNFKDEEGNEGGIGTRSKSFLLRQDGSGYIAKKNIVWDKDGKVTFNDGVTLNWDNFSEDAQSEMKNRYCRITGEDTFTVIGYDADAPTSPVSITLTIEEVGFTSTSEQRQWMYKNGSDWYIIKGANAKTLVITPDSELWGSATDSDSKVGGDSVLTVKCVVALDDSHVYTDTKTIRKQYVQGYTLSVTSSMGNSFKNGDCSTILTANVYYQGSLVDSAYVKEHFNFTWHRYDASDMTELELSNATVDGNTLTLDYAFDSNEIYICELSTIDAFDYSFPIIF